MFELPKSEVLTVTSAVSAVSTDAAYALVQSNGAKKHFSDKRQPKPKTDDSRLLAQNHPSPQQRTSTTKAHPHATASTAKPTKPTTAHQEQRIVRQPSSNVYAPTKWLEIATRDAELQAAFTAALKQLQRHHLKAKQAIDALSFIDAITPLYPTGATTDTQEADSVLRQTAQALFTGQQMTDAQAAWFIFNALGFVPDDNNRFRLVRPLFNVATLQLPRTRRLIIHTKNNTPRNCHIKQAILMHQPLTSDTTFSREQLIKGGIMEIKMQP